MWRIVRVVLISLALLVVVITAAGCLYWRSLRTTPQYSLALLIDAARRNDKAAIGELVDTDRVVDSFVPQIMSSAVDMYGRGLPQQTINNLAIVAQPVVPALKDRARTEVPKVIRDRTSKLD